MAAKLVDNKTLFCHFDTKWEISIEYSTADFTLNLLSYILFVVVLSHTFHDWKVCKRSRHLAKTVATAFCSCRHGEHSAGCCLPQTTFRSVIGDKRTRFPRNNSNADIRRSDSFYPFSAAWTVVCCVLDSAGGFRKLPFAREQTAYVSCWSKAKHLKQSTDNKTLFCHSDRAQRRGISWLYSPAYFTLKLLSYILFVVVLSCSFGPKRTWKQELKKTQVNNQGWWLPLNIRRAKASKNL